MQRIILRHILFDRDASKYTNTVSISTECARVLLPDDLATWCLQHSIQPQTISLYDPITQFLHFRIYALVQDSLATYYLLRWGQPREEQVHT